MKKITEMLIFIFGENKHKRLVRIGITLACIIFAIIMIQNLSCGYDKGEFYFKWQPAADIKINR